MLTRGGMFMFVSEPLTLYVMASDAVDSHLEAHVDVLASSVL